MKKIRLTRISIKTREIVCSSQKTVKTRSFRFARSVIHNVRIFARCRQSEYEKVIEKLKDVSRQYDKISRMNLNEKYKDYAKLKSDEFAKRAEAVAIRKGNAQAFMDIDEPRTMTAKFDDNNAKSDRLFKDAEDMAAKARRVENENKEIFSQA